MGTGHVVNRRDSWAKRRASGIANGIRRSLLHDDNPDTGCSLKLYERALFLRLPYFDHMHRYLPALAQREGASVEVVPVNHRARPTGASKYSNLGRALAGIPDLIGVIWLIRRAPRGLDARERSEEHTSEPQSLMRIPYAVLCLKKKININLRPKD